MAGDSPATAPRGTRFFEQVLATVLFLLMPLSAYANRGVALLLILCGVAALIHILAAGSIRKLRLPMGWTGLAALAGLAAWGLTSALWAETPGLAVPRTLQTAGLVLSGIAVLAALPSLDRRGRDLATLAATAGMLLFFALMAIDVYSGGILEMSVRRGLGLSAPMVWEAQRFKVAVSVCGILMPLLLFRHWRHGRRLPVLLLPPCLVVAGWAINSHTGMVAALTVALVTLAALVLPRLSAAVMGGAMAVAFLVAPMVMVRLPPVPELAASIKIMPNSMMHRLCIWRFTADHILERPVLGWGFDASRALPGGEDNIPVPVRAFEKIVMIDAQAMPLHPHNLMLQVWLEMGFVGVAGFIVLALSVIFAALRHRSLTAPALGMVAGVLVVGAASFGAWQAWWVASQWLLAVACVALLRSDDRSLALDGTGLGRATSGHNQF